MTIGVKWPVAKRDCRAAPGPTHFQRLAYLGTMIAAALPA